MSIDISSRRHFLATSAVAAAAAAAIGHRAYAGGGDAIRLGMIGCGGRCTGAAHEAMNADSGTRLVAMADLFADRIQAKLQALKKQNPDQVAVDEAHCFTGLNGYTKVIESCDVVLIACAAKFHAMYAKAALEAGKHVFVEKPHAIDPAGIKVLAQAVDIAKQKKLGLLSGLQSRFHAPIKETIQRVHDGQIGEIIAMEENFIRGPYGNIKRPSGSELEIQYGNQYRFSWLCGDDVTQSLVHNLDRATWAMRETPPVKCHGLGGRSTSQDLLGDVFDHHSVVYQYANGVRLYANTRTTLNCYNEISSTILGSKGTAYPLEGRITGERAWQWAGEKSSPYDVEHQKFFKSIRAGAPINCGDYMPRSTLVAIMGQLSCYSGKEVAWDAVTKSDFCFAPAPERCTWDMPPPTQSNEKGVYPVCFTPGVSKNI
ncbi:MAG TPA: Gfo/Idh/MocA family oxidoreductase [Planctomycetota bacterium]|nr:Gfo/Idh/MocA family oxidoreductase [Planctomycetota bacterium]